MVLLIVQKSKSRDASGIRKYTTCFGCVFSKNIECCGQILFNYFRRANFKYKDIKLKLKPKFTLNNKGQLQIKSIPLGSVTKMRSIKDAESVKVMENTVRDVNIALVNELAKMSEVLNLDVVDIIDGMTTKPFGKGPFYPGTGVGGHCISHIRNGQYRQKSRLCSKFIELFV